MNSKTDLVDFDRPTQENTRLDLQARFREAIHVVLESMLEEELKRMIGAKKYARVEGRLDERNGSYPRGVTTSQGKIDLQMPRSRKNGSPTEVLGRYARRTDNVDEMIIESYVQGISTRGMDNVTTALMGDGVASSTVSRIAKKLDEQVAHLRAEKIEQEVPYLYLDATFVKARWARSVESVAALVAYGVQADGHRKLLAVTIGTAEDEENWSDLLKQLDDRGLKGVRMVISDDNKGIKAAVRHCLPEAAHQRCTVHLMRNVLAKVPHTHKQRFARQLSEVFKAKGLEGAKTTLGRLKTTWGKLLPEAIECLQNGFVAATRFYEFPEKHWKRIHSTNALERLNREIKRRTRKVGAFPDRASTLRLVTAVALHSTESWGKRLYLDMSLLDPRFAKPRR